MATFLFILLVIFTAIGWHTASYYMHRCNHMEKLADDSQDLLFDLHKRHNEDQQALMEAVDLMDLLDSTYYLPSHEKAREEAKQFIKEFKLL
jgi:hypothetical protein